MQDLSSSNISVTSPERGEQTPLLLMQRYNLPRESIAQEEMTQRIANWLKNYVTPVIMPTLSALNGSAIASTIVTLSEGWPRDVSKVIAPAMYIGLPFNAIGFLDALGQEYKINRFNKFRHGYRVFINGTNTAIFSLQFLIAILDDIYETKNKPLNVSNAAFAGICVGPALLGLITLLIQGRDIKRPDDLKSLKNKIKYGLLGLLDLTNYASTAHSLIQYIAALTHPLMSPSGMLLRYSMALAPAFAVESIKISEHLPEHWFSKCMLNFPKSFLTFLRASPEQLFLIVSALNYAVFNEEVLRNNENDFSVLGAISVYVFWIYIIFLSLGIRLLGGLSPTEDESLNHQNNANPFYINYESDGDTSALSMQDDPAFFEHEDIETGRSVGQTIEVPTRPSEHTVLWSEALPFPQGIDFNAEPTDATLLPLTHSNVLTGVSVAQEIEDDSLQPISPNDLSAVQAIATPQAQAPATNTVHQLPVVSHELSLAPNSARHTRRHSIHAEIQRTIAMQQSLEAQRTPSTEHAAAPEVKNSNSQLRRST